MPLNVLLRQRMPPLTATFTSSRIFLYTVLSVVATITTIANACRNYSNFYSVAIYLSRSGRSLLVLANFGFLSALLSGRILQHIFFGPLQSREVERLYDQTWMFVTESLLAFTIFRDDFDIPFVIMFGFLLFIKCFHWLLADRVDSMDQVPFPGPPTLFHIRMNSLFIILWAIDFVMLAFAIDSTLNNGVGGMVLFANEYAILIASALNAMARYTLSSVDIRRARTRGGANAPAWENKSMYVFYIELVTDFLKLVTYLTFFVIVLMFYGLPLNMIRDVYLTARSFITRLRALVRYRNATRDMDRRYPNASEEELAGMSDRTCIICREEMVAPPQQNQNPPAPGQAPVNANNGQDGPNVTPKKLPCGHIFHFQCLRSWLERQQSCPTCRRTVLETDQLNRNNGRAGARNVNARPGPPQAGAVPMAGPAGQPNANLGWLARLLGLPVQPPLVQGQFPNGQVPPQFVPPGAAGPQMPANAGWAAPGQLPPGYLYPYPYQLQQQLPPQQLQPPPLYRGFYGPGGVWQPWGADPQWLAQGQQGQGQAQNGTNQAHSNLPNAHQSSSAGPSQVQAPASTIPVQTPATSAATNQTPTPPTTVPVASQADHSMDVAAASNNDRPSTPREAAALAALRRLDPSHHATLAPDTRPSLASVTASSTDGTATEASANIPPPTTESSSLSSTTGTGAASSVSPLPAADVHADVPQLIPLYDFRQIPTQGLSAAYLPPPYYRQPQNLPRMPGAPAQNMSSAPQNYRATSHTQPSRVPGQEPRYRPGASRGPLSQLPPTLTDEQLGRLDRLTRDAIDERLRVLEGVSGAVHRCIEELTRIRSVLPPRDPMANTAPTATSQGDSSTSGPTPTVGAVPAADASRSSYGKNSSDPTDEGASTSDAYSPANWSSAHGHQAVPPDTPDSSTQSEEHRVTALD